LNEKAGRLTRLSRLRLTFSLHKRFHAILQADKLSQVFAGLAPRIKFHGDHLGETGRAFLLCPSPFIGGEIAHVTLTVSRTPGHEEVRAGRTAGPELTERVSLRLWENERYERRRRLMATIHRVPAGAGIDMTIN